MSDKDDPLAACEGCLTALKYTAEVFSVISLAVLVAFAIVVLMGWV